MPIHKELDHDFFKTWTPEMAYVLGYFAADGSMIKTRRGGHYVEFSSTDRSLLEQVRRVVGSSHRIATRVRIRQEHRVQYRLQVGSKVWHTDLLTYGFTQNKSKKLKFPRVPGKFVADFVRGYFDGDGCTYVRQLKFADRKQKRWILLSLFTSGSKVFLSALQELLHQNGLVGGSLCQKERGYDLKFGRGDSIALYHFMYHTRRVSLYLPRKRRKFERAMRILGYKLRA